MAISSISSSRISGLASGLDTDQMVKDLMRAERIPLDKLYQKKQLAEWKRDDYRSITNLLRGLKDDYFNSLKATSNMLSQSAYKKFTGTSSNSEYVMVSGNANSVAGTHTISITNLATVDKAVSSSGVSDPLEGLAVSNYNLSGKKIKITLDGVTREITLDNYSYTAGSPSTSDIVSKASTGLQALVDTAFGAGKITVSYDGNTEKLKFTSIGGASKITLSSGTSNDGLAALGFTSGASNRININETLDSLKSKFATDLTFNAEGKLKFTINSKQFTFDKTTTLASMMNTINSDLTANVNMQYDETTDKFIITAKQLGDGDNIVIDAATQEGNFFGAGGVSGINTGSAATSQGVDAVVKIDGQTLKRSSNTFTVNGVTYNLLKAHSDPATQSETVSLSLDVDGIYDNIKKFVDKYNEVISTINAELSEEYDRDYLPLTDEEKESMSEEDIKKWEDKAKTGLLRNDSLLQNIVYDMRRALSDGVEGMSVNLSAIGITTGKYEEKGKLIIDETKLKAAIQNDPDGVMNLFSQQSDITSNTNLTDAQRSERYKEEGLAYRLFDIVEKNIRTVSGKGLLLQKAGIEGDTTEFTSQLYEQIDDYDDRIAELEEKLIDKENWYYKKFTAMETAISQMNTQSAWLTSQFSQG